MAGSALKDLVSSLLTCTAVDLSPRIEPGIPRWPTHPHLVVDPTVTHPHDGYFCQTISMAEHTGSHVDAPIHIHSALTDRTVDCMPVTQLIGRAVVYHLESLALGPGDWVTRDDLVRYEERTGIIISPGDIALLDFHWAPRYWTTTATAHWYATNAPGLDEEATRFFLERGVKAVGSDTIACDTALKDGVQLSAWGHQQHWLPHDIYIMEELVNLDRLPTEVMFTALALPIAQGSGSPIRAVAWIPQETILPESRGSAPSGRQDQER